MLQAIFKSFVFCVPLFFLVGIAGAISTFLVGNAGASKGLKLLSGILGLALGGCAVYVSLKVVSYFLEDSIFHWYYFVSMVFVIGSMNKAILNPNTTKRMYVGGTNALGGASLAGIIFLFIF